MVVSYAVERICAELFKGLVIASAPVGVSQEVWQQAAALAPDIMVWPSAMVPRPSPACPPPLYLSFDADRPFRKLDLAG